MLLLNSNLWAFWRSFNNYYYTIYKIYFNYCCVLLLLEKRKNNLRIMFKNVYPTSLSGMNFDTKDTEAMGLTATMTMNYDYYTLEVL